MQLTKDIAAPVFKLKDVFGRLINLSEYQDKKVLIAFFRHAGCPFCNLRVHSLMKMYDAFKKHELEMIFFFESKESVILRSSFHKEIAPIPLISDPGKQWYEVYGLENSAYKSTVSHLASFVQTAFKARSLGLPMHMMAGGESIHTMPAEFLLDKGLLIKKVLYSQRLNQRLELDEIMLFASKGKILD